MDSRVIGGLTIRGSPQTRQGQRGALARYLDFALRRQQTYDRLAAGDSFQHPDAQTIRPRWNGEPFDLHACVQACSPSNFLNRQQSKINKPRDKEA
jgi:hypothetical protein